MGELHFISTIPDYLGQTVEAIEGGIVESHTIPFRATLLIEVSERIESITNQWGDMHRILVLASDPTAETTLAGISQMRMLLKAVLEQLPQPYDEVVGERVLGIIYMITVSHRRILQIVRQYQANPLPGTDELLTQTFEYVLKIGK